MKEETGRRRRALARVQASAIPVARRGLIGRPPRLTPEFIAAVSKHIAEDGVPFETACRLAGVSGRSGYFWMAVGRALAQEIEQTEGVKVDGNDLGGVKDGVKEGSANDARKAVKEDSPDVHVSPERLVELGVRMRIEPSLYLQLFHAVEEARARDEAERIAQIKVVGRGGTLISKREVTRTDARGNTTTETEERYQPPEFAANAFLLERKDPQRWGRRFRPEVVAPEGEGPRAPTLLEILTLVYQRGQAGKDPRESPGVIEGTATVVKG